MGHLLRRHLPRNQRDQRDLLNLLLELTWAEQSLQPDSSILLASLRRPPQNNSTVTVNVRSCTDVSHNWLFLDSSSLKSSHKETTGEKTSLDHPTVLLTFSKPPLSLYTSPLV